MIDPTEEELWADMVEARLRPERRPRSARNYAAVRSIVPGRVYYVLADTPEQLEDMLVILVEDHTVVSFELDRADPDPKPRDVEIWSVADYRSEISDLGAMELDIALELARRDLSKL